MGYAIKKVSNKKGPNWKLQFIVYDKQSISELKNDRKIRDIPKSDWSQHGFNISMAYEDAKAKAKSLNAQADLKRWSEKKVKIRERIDHEDKIECAFLPEILVSKFETEILFEKLCRGSDSLKSKNKIESHWRCAKRLIREISIPPIEWADKSHKFYTAFARQKYSLAYVQKLVRILNEWGFFNSRDSKIAYYPIPFPRGSDAQHIANAFYGKSPKADGRASAPLTPKMLAKQESNLILENYNWLFISVWFGLRPQEIDNLKDTNTWEIITNNKGMKLLRVYQPKLIKVAPKKRWKVIPVKYPEQKKALALIELGSFRRPIYKVMHNWFGERVTLYGGRKGFTDLMLDRDEQFHEISLWMGHRTLDRTYRDYKDRVKLRYEDAS